MNIKDAKFCKAFNKCIYANFNSNEFEEYWHEMVQKFELCNNRWVRKAYERKEMWVHSYLQEKFCTGVQTTSQCEGINSFMKRFLKSRHIILKLVQNLDRVISDYRNNEVVAQFYTIYRKPVLTIGLDFIKRGAANVYTKEIFKEVKKDVNEVTSLIVSECERIGTTANMY